MRELRPPTSPPPTSCPSHTHTAPRCSRMCVPITSTPTRCSPLLVPAGGHRVWPYREPPIAPLCSFLLVGTASSLTVNPCLARCSAFDWDANIPTKLWPGPIATRYKSWQLAVGAVLPGTAASASMPFTEMQVAHDLATTHTLWKDYQIVQTREGKQTADKKRTCITSCRPPAWDFVQWSLLYGSRADLLKISMETIVERTSSSSLCMDHHR
jgi:hypothetical protein